MASEKQKKYIIYLLGMAGYDTKFMHQKYKNLGVSWQIDRVKLITSLTNLIKSRQAMLSKNY